MKIKLFVFFLAAIAGAGIGAAICYAACIPTSNLVQDTVAEECNPDQNYRILKGNYWRVQYPDQSIDVALKLTTGTGQCTSDSGLKCYPDFNSPVYGDGYWRQRIVNKQVAYGAINNAPSCTYLGQ